MAKTNRAASGQKIVSSTFRLDAPRYIWLQILKDHVGPYTFELACLSYRLDVDAGTVQSIREYARIWGWSKTRVGERIEEIRDEVKTWMREYDNQRDRNGTETGQNADSGADSKTGNSDEKEGKMGYKADSLQDNSGTAAGQNEGTYYTPPSPTPTPILQRENAALYAEGWTDETIQLYREYVDLCTKIPDGIWRRTFHALLQPKNSGRGARLPHTNEQFDGYTVEDIKRGLYDMKMDGHNSPTSLVKHVVGLIEVRGNDGTKKQKAKTTKEQTDDGGF